MQITRTSPIPAYERVLISRSSAGLPRTYRLVRRPGSAPALLLVLDAVPRDHDLADEVAAQARSRGRLARVTEVGARGVRLGDGERARNVWVVWTRVA